MKQFDTQSNHNKADLALADERHLLRTLVDLMPDDIFAKDLQSRFLFANRTVARRMGVATPEDLLGKTDFDFYPRAQAESFFADEQTVIASGQILTGREERVTDQTTGEQRWHLTIKIPLRDSTNKIIGTAGISRNITERKQAELATQNINAELESRVTARTTELTQANDILQAEIAERRQLETALAAERNLLRTLVDVMPDNIFAKDAQSRFLLANLSVSNVMGCATPEALIGKTDFDFYPKEIAIHFFEDEQRLIQSGQSLINHEERAIDQRTGEIRWLSTTKIPLRDSEKKVIGLVGISRNITGRKQAEAALQQQNAELTELNAKLSQAQEQLVQSEKLASIGQLAAGVAHEINNPIGYLFSNFNVLNGYLGNLFAVLAAYEAAESFISAPAAAATIKAVREQMQLDFVKEDIGMLMRESQEGIVRVRKIVQDLRDFSHVDSKQEWQWTDLHKGIDSTLNIINSEIKYKADVVKEYGTIPEVECLASQINQVVMNLVINAVHAMGTERGKITVRTRCGEEHVWIEVADNGSGILKENLTRIFDPFYTTKPVGKGTGLGLSLSYGIVQKHHGRIDVESEIGCGTTFRITLPIKRVQEV